MEQLTIAPWIKSYQSPEDRDTYPVKTKLEPWKTTIRRSIDNE
jgi:hypothetical protein